MLRQGSGNVGFDPTHRSLAPRQLDPLMHDRTPLRTWPFQTSRVVLPLPWGEGWGEGEGITLSFTAFFSPVGSGLNSTVNSEEPHELVHDLEHQGIQPGFQFDSGDRSLICCTAAAAASAARSRS